MCAKPSANVQKPFVDMQCRLQICKAACRFARPRAHVPESDFISTLCFNEVQASGDVCVRCSSVVIFLLTRDFCTRYSVHGCFGTTTEQLRSRMAERIHKAALSQSQG